MYSNNIQINWLVENKGKQESERYCMGPMVGVGWNGNIEICLYLNIKRHTDSFTHSVSPSACSSSSIRFSISSSSCKDPGTRSELLHCVDDVADVTLFDCVALLCLCCLSWMWLVSRLERSAEAALQRRASADQIVSVGRGATAGGKKSCVRGYSAPLHLKWEVCQWGFNIPKDYILDYQISKSDCFSSGNVSSIRKHY